MGIDDFSANEPGVYTATSRVYGIGAVATKKSKKKSSVETKKSAKPPMLAIKRVVPEKIVTKNIQRDAKKTIAKINKKLPGRENAQKRATAKKDLAKRVYDKNERKVVRDKLTMKARDVIAKKKIESRKKKIDAMARQKAISAKANQKKAIQRAKAKINAIKQKTGLAVPRRNAVAIKARERLAAKQRTAAQAVLMNKYIENEGDKIVAEAQKNAAAAINSMQKIIWELEKQVRMIEADPKISKEAKQIILEDKRQQINRLQLEIELQKKNNEIAMIDAYLKAGKITPSTSDRLKANAARKAASEYNKKHPLAKQQKTYVAVTRDGKEMTPSQVSEYRDKVLALASSGKISKTEAEKTATQINSMLRNYSVSGLKNKGKDVVVVRLNVSSVKSKPIIHEKAPTKGVQESEVSQKVISKSNPQRNLQEVGALNKVLSRNAAKYDTLISQIFLRGLYSQVQFQLAKKVVDNAIMQISNNNVVSSLKSVSNALASANKTFEALLKNTRGVVRSKPVKVSKEMHVSEVLANWIRAAIKNVA